MGRLILAAVRAMAAVLAVTTKWVWEAGKWVLKSFARPALPEPQDVLDQYVEVAENVQPKQSSEESWLAAIKSVAADLIYERVPDKADMAELGDRTRRWLATLNNEMLMSVSRAKVEDLREHLAQRKSIRGLLAFDDESVAEYRRAIERDAEAPAPAPPASRRTRRVSKPLLPAFGPIA